MTDNQRRAIDELSQYREAKRNIEYHEQQVQVIEARVTRATRACDSLMQETIIDGQLYAVPMAVQTSSGRNAAEDLIDALMEARLSNMRRQAEAERLCMRLECSIFDRCAGSHARILSKLFLYGLSLERIAVSENYSFRQTLRKKWRALEVYGEKMALNVTLR